MSRENELPSDVHAWWHVRGRGKRQIHAHIYIYVGILAVQVVFDQEGPGSKINYFFSSRRVTSTRRVVDWKKLQHFEFHGISLHFNFFVSYVGSFFEDQNWKRQKWVGSKINFQMLTSNVEIKSQNFKYPPPLTFHKNCLLQNCLSLPKKALFLIVHSLSKDMLVTFTQCFFSLRCVYAFFCLCLCRHRHVHTRKLHVCIDVQFNLTDISFEIIYVQWINELMSDTTPGFLSNGKQTQAAKWTEGHPASHPSLITELSH